MAKLRDDLDALATEMMQLGWGACRHLLDELLEQERQPRRGYLTGLCVKKDRLIADLEKRAKVMRELVSTLEKQLANMTRQKDNLAEQVDIVGKMATTMMEEPAAEVAHLKEKLAGRAIEIETLMMTVEAKDVRIHELRGTNASAVSRQRLQLEKVCNEVNDRVRLLERQLAAEQDNTERVRFLLANMSDQVGVQDAEIQVLKGATNYAAGVMKTCLADLGCSFDQEFRDDMWTFIRTYDTTSLPK